MWQNFCFIKSLESQYSSNISVHTTLVCELSVIKEFVGIVSLTSAGLWELVLCVHSGNRLREYILVGNL